MHLNPTYLLFALLSPVAYAAPTTAGISNLSSRGQLLVSTDVNEQTHNSKPEFLLISPRKFTSIFLAIRFVHTHHSIRMTMNTSSPDLRLYSSIGSVVWSCSNFQRRGRRYRAI
ncbi:hypothetical protein F5890DRAFT_1073522 [Lentinula detonsa]|uniref:Uncharacterized protein n=1 Tax=Lentinula detonsa TaxID=2804962 RepID=A0AA38UM46_9AGAR|nr:hypothetical protein F5890DRAFT_1073522 [Lentinula detonsa]